MFRMRTRLACFSCRIPGHLDSEGVLDVVTLTAQSIRRPVMSCWAVCLQSCKYYHSFGPFLAASPLTGTVVRVSV